MPRRPICLILHSKAADRADIATAVGDLRSAGYTIEVIVTEKSRGAKSIAREYARDEIVVVAGGGDGTINEAASGLSQVPGRRACLGILPAGTANDFASGCMVPEDPAAALRLAAEGAARQIDLVRAGPENLIVNCGTAVFTGEHVDVPGDAKRLLGGAAYWLQGVLRTLQLEPRALRWRWPGGDDSGSILLMTVANGVQTGGGAKVAGDALLDDGLFDVRLVRDFPLVDLPSLISELADPLDGPDGYIAQLKVPWLEVEPDEPWGMTVDGEDLEFSSVRFEILPRALDVVLPASAPLLVGAAGEIEKGKLRG